MEALTRMARRDRWESVEVDQVEVVPLRRRERVLESPGLRQTLFAEMRQAVKWQSGRKRPRSLTASGLPETIQQTTQMAIKWEHKWKL
jgi:hypothetical protein